jgi:hypothetical protein
MKKRRGRPCLARPEVDLGTEQLRAKRQYGITMEPLDYLHQRGLLTDRQHKTGLWLRWLYTLRHGAPTLQSSLCHIPGKASTRTEEERMTLEAQYLEAITILKQYHAAESVCALVIHHQFPRTIDRVRMGLDALSIRIS